MIPLEAVFKAPFDASGFDEKLLVKTSIDAGGGITKCIQNPVNVVKLQGIEWVRPNFAFRGVKDTPLRTSKM